MPATTLRLEHAELCACCTDILPTGTTVRVHDDGMVTCLGCESEPGGVRHGDPWGCIDDPTLREALHRRRLVAAA